jgi:hypothetical protein
MNQILLFRRGIFLLLEKNELCRNKTVYPKIKMSYLQVKSSYPEVKAGYPAFQKLECSHIFNAEYYPHIK